VSAVEDLTRDYRVAFLQYLARHEEVALTRGYELGRSVIADGLSILDLAQVHHAVLLEVLRDTPTAELPTVATAASEFFVEVLAAFDMAQRTFTDVRRAGPPEAPEPRSGRGVTAPRRRSGPAAGPAGGHRP
jgi:hypothetical protein